MLLRVEIFYLQLGKVDIGGVEGEADGEAELGVHEESHLVLGLLHCSLLHQNQNQFNEGQCFGFT